MTMVHAGSSNSPDESYFNDLTQQPPPPRRNSPSDPSSSSDPLPRETTASKKIACILCRKRKLRCDGGRPKCGTCTRLNHDCGYDEVRKKSGPKRGYVKLLEARLQQVETLLKTQDHTDQRRSSPEKTQENSPTGVRAAPTFGAVPNQRSTAQDVPTVIQTSSTIDTSETFAFMTSSTDAAVSDPFPWEVIGLGLEEPLPTQDVIDELHQIYFERVHPSQPLIHKYRYLAAMNLAPSMRPPICLRYIIWCLAAGVSDKYDPLTDRFYQRARKYAELDEMRGHGEAILTLAHCQTWFLCAVHEFKNMYFPRAWQSTGRAARSALMFALNRLDGAGLDVKQCLPPPKDWTEKEERRRTFWMCFCADRYASIGTGWPMMIDERDIMTLLPSSEEAFEKSKPETAPSLEQAMSSSTIPDLSSISASIVITVLLGRNLTHLHRPTPNDNEGDLNGEFWKRHRQLESILSSISLSLPDHLRLPAGLPDPCVVFMNMLMHTSVICLHQAAIFKADKNDLPGNVIMESRARCVTAAAETARVMRMTSHLDLSMMNPFLAFCLYVAARVFIQYLKWKPKEPHMIASLQFLLAAMHALKRKNILTESFIAQLDVDLEGSGIDLGPRQITPMPRGPMHNQPNTVNHSPMVDIRDTQRAAFQSRDFAPGIDGQRQHCPDPLMTGYDSMRDKLQVNQGFAFPLPNRNRTGGIAESVSPMSDMDCSPDSSTDPSGPKSRSNSYRDSSSHTSFTPPSHDEVGQYQGVTNMSKNSPSTIGSASGIGTPGGMTNATEPTLFPDGGATFTAMSPGQFMGNSFAIGSPFPMASGPTGVSVSSWDMAGLETTTAGGAMAGLSDARWTEMLSSVQDWSNVPLEQVFEAIGKQSTGESG